MDRVVGWSGWGKGIERAVPCHLMFTCPTVLLLALARSGVDDHPSSGQTRVGCDAKGENRDEGEMIDVNVITHSIWIGRKFLAWDVRSS